MNYSESQKVDNAIALLETMRDVINELESDKEKLEEREKELMDKCDDLNDIIKDLRSEKEYLEEELSHYDVRDKHDR